MASRPVTDVPAHTPLLRSDDSRGVMVDVPRTGSRVRCHFGSPTQRLVLSVTEPWYVVLGVPIVQRWREVARCGSGGGEGDSVGSAAQSSDTDFALRVREKRSDAALRHRPFQTLLIVAWDSGATRWSQLERYAAMRVGDSLTVAFGPPPGAAVDRGSSPSMLATVRIGPLWPIVGGGSPPSVRGQRSH